MVELVYMQKYIAFTALLFTFSLPFQSEASHRTGGVDRSSLDEEIVEDIYVPILFGVVVDDIIPDFGQSRGGGTRTHEGQDMLSPRGAPIVSPTEAIVIATGDGDSSGKYVYTANPGGETFRYMHLDKIANLDRGDKLQVGDYIGTVGDTGNAPDGVYHLHFEIRDEENEPLDPAERLTKDFSLKQRMSFLKDLFIGIRNDKDVAEFLVENFPGDFTKALQEKYDLPDDVDDVLEEMGFKAQLSSLDKLSKLIEAIPAALQIEIKEGDSGTLVQLLQLYLIYTTDNSARDILLQSGPTGFYGPRTSDAVRAYQDEHNIPETGSYDTKTRAEMMKHSAVLNIN